MKFVSLHNHTCFSIFDGLGYPPDHLDYAYELGMPALAFTEHGNMNSLPHAYLHWRKMRDAGHNIKLIYGAELYVVPSLEEWRELYEIESRLKKQRKMKAASGVVVEDGVRTTGDSLRKRRHLLLLAHDEEGLSNLFQLISKSYLSENHYYYPRVDYRMLREHADGLLAGGACMSGILAETYYAFNGDMTHKSAMLDHMADIIDTMQSIFGRDKFFGELQWHRLHDQHNINELLLEAKRQLGLPLVTTIDAHFARPELWEQREMYRRLGWLGKKDKEPLPTLDDLDVHLWLKNDEEIWREYKTNAEWAMKQYDDDEVAASIEYSCTIADMCEQVEPDTAIKLPSFVVPDGADPDEVLDAAVRCGAQNKGIFALPGYRERLAHELAVIEANSFSQYFLTMRAISDRARKFGLVGPGRGSAAGSLVSYCLDITQVDPIRFDLLFSRFMSENQASIGMPDIDYDVSEPLAFKDQLINEWGATTVVPISNWNRLKLKSLIKDVARYFEIPFTEVNAVTKVMLDEATPAAKDARGIKAGVYTPTLEEVLEHSESLSMFFETYPKVAEHVRALYGQLKSAGRHAGGLLVYEDLHKHMPLIRSGNVTQAPWSEGMAAHHLEPLGFVKFDILGLSTLTMIETAVASILHNSGQESTFNDIYSFYQQYLHPDVLDFADKNVWQNVFCDGNFLGIFQFTQRPVQQFCMQVAPTTIEELSAITSIYRPGPLGAGVDDAYLAAKQNPNSITYVHPILQDILGDTYGNLIYQEQIAQISHRMGYNISLDEGNLLRKVFSKWMKDISTVAGATLPPEKQAIKDSLEQRFYQGCTNKGLTLEQTNALWNSLYLFSFYGFNKSHSCSYAIISYICAWLYTYYPAEWCAAFLAKEPDSRREQAIAQVKNAGFNVIPANINLSAGYTWAIAADGKTLVQPLMSLKGVGEKAIDEIIHQQTFADIESFLFNEHMDYRKVNRRVIESLILAGALDIIRPTDCKNTRHLWRAAIDMRPKLPKKLTPELFRQNLIDTQSEPEFDHNERVAQLCSITGIYPWRMIVSPLIERDLQKNGVVAISDYVDDELTPVVWFVVRSVKTLRTKNGNDYYILSVSDNTGLENNIKCWGIDVGRDIVRTNRVYIARLKYEDKWGFSARRIWRTFIMQG